MQIWCLTLVLQAFLIFIRMKMDPMMLFVLPKIA